jgi:hypothetical protein
MYQVARIFELFAVGIVISCEAKYLLRSWLQLEKSLSARKECVSLVLKAKHNAAPNKCCCDLVADCAIS